MNRTVAIPTASERFVATGLGPVLDERGIKSAWLARRVGVSRGHMTNVVKGRRTVGRPAAETVAALLGVPLFLLFRFDGSNVSVDPSSGGAK